MLPGQRFEGQYIGASAACPAAAAVLLLRFSDVTVLGHRVLGEGENQAMLRRGQVDYKRPASRYLAFCSRPATYPVRLHQPGRLCWLF